MKQVFRSRIDWWIAAILIAIVLTPLFAMPMKGANFILEAVISLLVLSTFHTVYVIKEGKLRVWVGFIRLANKDIQQVQSVLRTSSILSAPALSLDRLLITFANGDRLVISPKDRDGFIAALRAVNEHIATDDTIDELIETEGVATLETTQPSKTSIWTNVMWTLCAVVAVAQAAYNVAIYDSLPDRIATHFDLNGEPNGWMGRFAGLWGLYAVGVGCALVMWAIPHIPGLKFSGEADGAPASQLQKSRQKLSFGLSINALFILLVIVFVNLYIIGKN